MLPLRIWVSTLDDHPLPCHLVAIYCLCVAKHATLEDFVRETAVEIVCILIPRIFLNLELVGHLVIILLF